LSVNLNQNLSKNKTLILPSTCKFSKHSNSECFYGIGEPGLLAYFCTRFLPKTQFDEKAAK
jgi:hypothetical protein